MFDVDENTRNQYPNFSNYIDNASMEYRNNGNIFQITLQDASSLSDTEINTALAKDEGPTLKVTECDDDKNKYNGLTTATEKDVEGNQYNINKGNGLIKIDNNVASIYEDAIKTGDESKISSATTIVESTVFHELIHYGNLKNTKSENGKYKKEDSGAKFEENIYGRNINRSDYQDYIRINQKINY